MRFPRIRLTAALGRLRWLAAHTVIAVIGTVVLLVATGLAGASSTAR